MRFLFYYLAAVNVAAWVIYGLDKWKARSGMRRISEKTLLLIAFFGGSAGAAAGMMLFRHKTRKPRFVVGVPVMLICHCLILGVIIAGTGGR